MPFYGPPPTPSHTRCEFLHTRFRGSNFSNTRMRLEDLSATPLFPNDWREISNMTHHLYTSPLTFWHSPSWPSLRHTDSKDTQADRRLFDLVISLGITLQDSLNRRWFISGTSDETAAHSDFHCCVTAAPWKAVDGSWILLPKVNWNSEFIRCFLEIVAATA